jgi:hypothetical protein
MRWDRPARFCGEQELLEVVLDLRTDLVPSSAIQRTVPFSVVMA